jgi:Flp pilus assembly protein TadB
MKHILIMVVGCVLALLLIFLLPAMRLGSGWMLGVAFGTLMFLHLMHFRQYRANQKEEENCEHQN